ncbi:unnamed protein product [Cylicocyclus nassatus]|uniref:Uncharacterized protein n=1 Tax=Cylicocyclus nassatus TaxID=53992 RepID=A0AA36MC50_CYLNA|nr:unnamed protein product [Cylicocyclus nassatus]
MRWWSNASLSSLFLVVAIAFDPLENAILSDRSAKQLPFLLTSGQTSADNQRFYPFPFGLYNSGVAHPQEYDNSLYSNTRRNRRNGNIKRFTCRFKFCRLFDE